MTIAFTERSYIRHVYRKALVAGASVLLVAGCGGSSQSRWLPPPTKASFAADANRVCLDTKTHRGRIAGLRKLRPPADERDLFGHWLSAERLAVHANDVIAGRKKEEDKATDPVVQLAVAQGEIAGYAGRLGADACRGAPGVRMPS
jgi:hypothetical protein